MSPSSAENKNNPFKNVKAIAIYDDLEKKTYTQAYDWMFCKECGGYNVEEIKIDDVIDNDHLECGQYTIAPCLICGKKLKCIGYGKLY